MASLNFHLNEISEEDLHLDCELNRVDLQLEDGDPDFKGTLGFQAEIVQEETEIRVKGTLQGTLLQECVRCLNVFEEKTVIPIVGYYRTQDAESSLSPKGKKQAEPDEADEGGERYHIEHNQFHLAAMLREHLILATAMHPVCHEGCQGMCQICGQNLNQSVCACGEVKIKSPFSVLRNVMPSSRKL